MEESTDPFLREFGRRVRRRRSDLQLTQAAVARHIGMSPTQFGLLERGGQRLIRLEQVAQLADALQTTCDYLMQRSEERGDIPARWGRGEETPMEVALLSPSRIFVVQTPS